MIQRVKGTQDFLDMSLFNNIIQIVQNHLQQYHFTHIATPILEPVELFKRSLGLETDIITKEMFIIDTGGDEGTICLRPEATAATMRAFLEHAVQQTPWKVFSVGPMFRHERPQKGRFREFHQINVEIIGASSIMHDVQFIKMLDRLFQEKFTLDSYALLINFLGCPADRERFKEKLYAFLTTIQDQICENCLVRKEKNILRVFDCKVEKDKQLYNNAPEVVSFLCKPCLQEWQQLREQLELLSVSYSYNPRLVRGLDYYDKTVFEFVSDNLGAQNAFCGGGRYNRLALELGAQQDYPSIGVAIGIERLLLLLESIKDRLIVSQPPALHVVLPLSIEQQSLALLVADEMQAYGLCVDILLDSDSIKSMMRKANKMGAKYCIIIGSDEQAARQVTIKDMITGQEERISQIDMIQYLKK